MLLSQLISDLIIRDTMADGINLHAGWRNVTIELSSIRNTGDDSIALWSQTPYPDLSNTIRNNYIQLPIIANGVAVYGGGDNTVLGNRVFDTVLNGGGIHVGNRFGSVPLSGNTLIDGNTIVRCGNIDSGWGAYASTCA
jgi:hypothetical protein